MSKGKILLVEDEKDLAVMLTFRLESSGYEVSNAYDGAEGLRKAREENPDLVILDVMLPSMDGYEICKNLKGDASSTKIPVLLLTVKSRDEDKQLGQLVGADAYVTKPFQPKDLLTKIEALLNGSGGLKE